MKPWFEKVLCPAAIAGVLLLAGCAAKPDLTKPFEIFHNEDRYTWEVLPPQAFIILNEYESESPFRAIKVVYTRASAMGRVPALEILIYPGTPVGTETAFGADVKGGPVEAVFHPTMRPISNDGMVMDFSSHAPGGGGSIFIDQLNPVENGRIKGRVIHARMRAIRFNMRTQTEAPSPEEDYMELWNFAFDAVMVRSYDMR